MLYLKIHTSKKEHPTVVDILFYIIQIVISDLFKIFWFVILSVNFVFGILLKHHISKRSSFFFSAVLPSI